MRRRLLLVEDEASIAAPLAFLLEDEGFKVTTVPDGEAALKAVAKKDPDLILLDLMLPGISGIEVCQRIRATSDVPIIMLTARGAEIDKVVGLEVGADDYVTKPYSSRELVARIRSVMRRATPSPDVEWDGGLEVSQVGPLTLDRGRHHFTYDGVEVELPLKEFQLLGVLLEQVGRVVSRGSLLERVWGPDFFGDERTLDVHVKRLRSRLEAVGAQRSLIATVRGVGYRFDAPE